MINIIRAMERSRLDIHACARLLYTRTEARGATGTLSMAPNEPIGSISRARYDTSNQSRIPSNFSTLPKFRSNSTRSNSNETIHFFPQFPFLYKTEISPCVPFDPRFTFQRDGKRATRRDDCATDERPAYLSTTFTQREKSFEKTRPFGRMRRASERLS